MFLPYSKKNYRSFFQWHLGFFAKQYTPTYRGFKSHFGYWLGAGDYWDHTAEGSNVGVRFFLFSNLEKNDKKIVVNCSSCIDSNAVTLQVIAIKWVGISVVSRKTICPSIIFSPSSLISEPIGIV